MNGCNIEDCLKQFTAAEQIQNYTCIQCWHANALQYLSLRVEENEVRVSCFSLISKFVLFMFSFPSHLYFEFSRQKLKQLASAPNLILVIAKIFFFTKAISLVVLHMLSNSYLLPDAQRYIVG